MTLPPDPEPLQWAMPESLEIPPEPLRMRLDFYGSSIVMTTINGDDTISTKMVSAVDISRAMTREVTLSSGFLPEGALWWSRGRDGDRVALWREPKVTRLAVQAEAFKPPVRFRIPMPGLLFLVQSQRAPMVYAARARPSAGDDVLYHAPTYNVFSDGRVCPGTHAFPEELERIPESFFQSLFSLTGDHSNRSKSKKSLSELWASLDGEKVYPYDDLVAWGPVERLMAQRNL